MRQGDGGFVSFGKPLDLRDKPPVPLSHLEAELYER